MNVNEIIDQIEGLFVLTKLVDNNFDNIKIPEELGYEIKKLNFAELSIEELKGFKFGHWDKDLYLVPGYLFDYIADGVELISIFDEKCIKGINPIDRDTRFGCIAFGFDKTNLIL